MIYKQPLIVDVNIEFTSLVDGVLAFATDQNFSIPVYEQSSFPAIDQILTLNGTDSQTIDGSILPTVVPTLGGIIRSMQPVAISGTNNGFGPTKSTRFDTMIGGNGDSGGSSFFSDATGFLAPFNAAYGYATSSALSEAGFGSQLLNGVSDLASGIASSASMITGAFNNSVNQIGAIADTVSLGAFSQTQFARNLRQTQNKLNQNTQALNTCAGTVNMINSTLQGAAANFGSLLDVPIA